MRIFKNPLNSTLGDIKCRHSIIPRIKSIRTLNGSPILPVERKDSELQYLKDCLNEYNKLSKDTRLTIDEYMRENHPRWTELIGIYGNPADLINKTVDVMKGSININAVNIKIMSDSSNPIEKKVPLSLTVAALKGLCGKLLKSDSTNMKIVI